MKEKIEFNKDHAEFFKDVEFVVEATSEEYMCFWQHYAHQSPHRLYPNVVIDWHQEHEGRSPVIGELAGFPVAVSLRYAKLNGHRVAFYESESRVVDHTMVRAWIEYYLKTVLGWKDADTYRCCNAANFNHCCSFVGARKYDKPVGFNSFQFYGLTTADEEKVCDLIFAIDEAVDWIGDKPDVSKKLRDALNVFLKDPPK